MAESVVNLTEDGVAYIEFQKTITQSDLDNGLTVYGQATAEHGINEINGVAYELVTPFYDATLTLINNTPKDYYEVGDTIEWTLRLTNTGNYPIRGGGGSIYCPQLMFGEIAGGCGYSHSDPINPGGHFDVHVSTTVREVPPLQIGTNEITVTATYSGDHISGLYEYQTFAVLRPAPESFDELTWAEIAELEPSEEWIGRSKTIALNESAFTSGTKGQMTGTVTCLGINHDNVGDGKRAKFTFRLDWIPLTTTNGPNIAGMMLNCMPSDLRAVLTPVFRGGQSTSVSNTFFLYVGEVTGVPNSYNGLQYQYFKDHPGTAARILTFNGTPAAYHLSDGVVQATGTVTNGVSSSTIGFAPCFCVGEYTPTLEDATLEELSWAEITALEPDEKYIGQSKTITLDRTQFEGVISEQYIGDMTGTVTCIGINHDDKVSGGKAKFTFRFDWIPVRRCLDPERRTNIRQCDVLTFLSTAFVNAMPDELRPLLATVSKEVWSVSSIEAKVWLFSAYEVFGSGGSEGLRYPWFTTATYRDIFLDFDGTLTDYWLRTFYSTSSGFWVIGTTTSAATFYAQSQGIYGIAPGFCIDCEGPATATYSNADRTKAVTFRITANEDLSGRVLTIDYPYSHSAEGYKYPCACETDESRFEFIAPTSDTNSVTFVGIFDKFPAGSTIDFRIVVPSEDDTLGITTSFDTDATFVFQMDETTTFATLRPFEA